MCAVFAACSAVCMPKPTAQEATALGRAVPHVNTRTSTSFAIEWAAVNGATHYDVYINGTNDKSFNATHLKVLNQTTRTYTVSDASTSSTDYAWVVAKNATGIGTLAPLGTLPAAAPAANRRP